MPLIASAVIGGVNALGKGVLGGLQLSHANKLRKEAGPRPQYSIQDEYLNNQSVAENMAQSGMSQEAKDYFTSNADRGLGAGISATLQAGGNPNSIANLYDTYDTNIARVAAQDSEAQNDNLRYLMNVNKDVAGQKTIQWSLNKLDPWKDTMQAATDEKAAGVKNVTGALSDAASTLSSYSIGQNYAKLAANPGMPPVVANKPMIPELTIDPTADLGDTPAMKKAKIDALKMYPNSPYLKSLYPAA